MKKTERVRKWNIRAAVLVVICLFSLQVTSPMIAHATQVEDNDTGEGSENSNNEDRSNNGEGSSSQSSSKSPDNSLSALTLSAGELSPKFYYSTTEYTATVPYETTSVEVNAKPSNNKATLESITGNYDLKPGENVIKIIVKAENDAKAIYTIKVTREEEPAATESPQNGGAGETTGNGEGTGTGEATGTDTNVQVPEGIVAGVTGTPDVTVTNEQIEEYESRIATLEKLCQELENKYKEAKSSARKTAAISGFVIIVLIIAGVNVFLFMKRRNDEMDEYDFDDEMDGYDLDDEMDEYDLNNEMEDEPEIRESGVPSRKAAPVKETKDIEIIDFDEF